MSEKTLLQQGEAVVGRVTTPDQTLILTTRPVLIAIDAQYGVAETLKLRDLRPGEKPSGLALLHNGTLWTMLTPRTLGGLSLNGRVIDRIPRSETSIFLYGAGQTLIFHLLPAAAGGPILLHGTPRQKLLQPFGPFSVRSGATQSDRVVLNIVGCGGSALGEVPCWFAQDTDVVIVFRDGAHRRVMLEARVWADSQPPATVEGHPQPIRDVYIDAEGVIWSLWTRSDRPEATANLGWRLARHDGMGRLLASTVMPEPARAIVQAGVGSARVLGRWGQLREITLP